MSKFIPNKITTPAEHRALLLATMEAVLDGRCSVAMGNTVADLSQQVHQSIKSEWDMRCYAAEDSMTCVARGAGKVLEDLDRLEKVLSSLDRRSTVRPRRR